MQLFCDPAIGPRLLRWSHAASAIFHGDDFASLAALPTDAPRAFAPASFPNSSGIVASSRRRSICEKRRPSVSVVNMNDGSTSSTGAASGLVRFTGDSTAHDR